MTGALSKIVGDILKLSEIDCFAIGVGKTIAAALHYPGNGV